jgi:hypothetical protein
MCGMDADVTMHSDAGNLSKNSICRRQRPRL